MSRKKAQSGKLSSELVLNPSLREDFLSLFFLSTFSLSLPPSTSPSHVLLLSFLFFSPFLYFSPRA